MWYFILGVIALISVISLGATNTVKLFEEQKRQLKETQKRNIREGIF